VISVDLRTSAAHVFVHDLDAPELSTDDEHHLRRVLRLRSGETITLTDGAGRWAPAQWTGGLAPAPSVELAGPAVLDESLGPAVGVGVAAVSGGADRIDWAVQKLTEIGVDHVMVFVADRSGVRWDAARLAKQEARHKRQAREAAMQSRRTTLPRLGVVSSSSAAVADLADLCGDCLRADFDGPSLADRTMGSTSGGGSVPELAAHDDRLPSVLVGPPGGWSEEELALIPATCSFGSTVLRTETAAMVAATLLMAHRTARTSGSRSVM